MIRRTVYEAPHALRPPPLAHPAPDPAAPLRCGTPFLLDGGPLVIVRSAPTPYGRLPAETASGSDPNERNR